MRARYLAFLTTTLLLLTLSASAQNVTGSAHDFSSGGTSTYKGASNEICVYCHTPHNATGTAAPLWNHAVGAGPYTMYSSATINMTIAASPQGVSLACLGCHDGTVAIDAFGGSAGTSTNKIPGGNSHNLTTNLANDHPISITYDTTKDTAFVAKASVIAAGLPLYGGGADQVECGSCHNPHKTTYGSFLRISNSASAVCKTCHTK